MKTCDILYDFNQGRLDEEKANEILSEILDSNDAGNVKNILSLSDIEWTAKAQGADWRDIARWRYLGWPKKCQECGSCLSAQQFGWRVFYKDDNAFLMHIRCP